MPEVVHKDFTVETDKSLLEEKGQVRVVLSSGAIDRGGDIVVQKGMSFDNYRLTKSVLFNHDQAHPVASCVELGFAKGGNLEAVAQFPPEGKLKNSDDCRNAILYGLINAVSVGFLPTEAEPVDARNPRKGLKFLTSELLEFSFVTVPANPDALIARRTFQPVAGVDKLLSTFVRKSLYNVAALARLLSEMGYLHDSVAYEASRTGNDSEVPGTLADAFKSLGEVLLTMTPEAVAEPMAGKDGLAARLDGGAVLEAVAGLTKADPTPRQLFERGRITRSEVDVTLKAGRAMSAVNEGKMRDAHRMIEGGLKAASGCLDEMTAGNDKSMTGARIKRQREIELLQLDAPGA